MLSFKTHEMNITLCEIHGNNLMFLEKNVGNYFTDKIWQSLFIILSFSCQNITAFSLRIINNLLHLRKKI